MKTHTLHDLLNDLEPRTLHDVLTELEASFPLDPETFDEDTYEADRRAA